MKYLRFLKSTTLSWIIDDFLWYAGITWAIMTAAVWLKCLDGLQCCVRAECQNMIVWLVSIYLLVSLSSNQCHCCLTTHNLVPGVCTQHNHNLKSTTKMFIFCKLNEREKKHALKAKRNFFLINENLLGWHWVASSFW